MGDGGYFSRLGFAVVVLTWGGKKGAGEKVCVTMFIGYLLSILRGGGGAFGGVLGYVAKWTRVEIHVS